jgi:hypothetical protein
METSNIGFNIYSNILTNLPKLPSVSASINFPSTKSFARSLYKNAFIENYSIKVMSLRANACNHGEKCSRRAGVRD